METTKIKQFSDFDISIDDSFKLVLNDIIENKSFTYPAIIIDKQIDIDVPKYLNNINLFLSKKIKKIKGKDVEVFLDLIKFNLTPFIWSLMKDAKIDIYLHKTNLYIKNKDDENKYIILNSKNINIDIINKLYKVQNKSYINSVYKECLDELYTFIRNKITNGFGHNDLVNSQIDNYKTTESKLENEFQNKNYNFSKILFFYESLIRIKEKFLNENHFLISENEIEETYKILKKIREMINQNHKYNISQLK